MMAWVRLAVVAWGTGTFPVPLGSAFVEASAVTGTPPSSTAAALDDVTRRLDSLDAEIDELRLLAAREVDPLVRVLTGRTETTRPRAVQIAVALVREGRRTGIEARVLLAVLLVENPWLDTHVLSSAGAVGLMQVMPFHAGGWGCAGTDLTDLDINICHGASVLAHALVLSGGDLDRALLRYNGCVLGPDLPPPCHRYPEWVRSRLAHVNDVGYLTPDPRAAETAG
jgi:soluble lytic murein transglycosylase-like protein